MDLSAYVLFFLLLVAVVIAVVQVHRDAVREAIDVARGRGDAAPRASREGGDRRPASGGEQVGP